VWLDKCIAKTLMGVYKEGGVRGGGGGGNQVTSMWDHWMLSKRKKRGGGKCKVVRLSPNSKQPHGKGAGCNVMTN